MRRGCGARPRKPCWNSMRPTPRPPPSRASCCRTSARSAPRTERFRSPCGGAWSAPEPLRREPLVVRGLLEQRADVATGGGERLLLGRIAHRQAFGAHDAHVGDADEAEHGAQVALLVVQAG